jgi:hypothetical protein
MDINNLVCVWTPVIVAMLILLRVANIFRHISPSSPTSGSIATP